MSSAGLVPVLALADSIGLRALADEHLGVLTDKGANAGLKVASLVAEMVAGADSIEDMGLLRHGGMGRVFKSTYAPSTLGSFLRAFTFGHVRQLDAVASRFMTGLAAQGALKRDGDQGGHRVLVDIDDTIVEVHGYAKQGSGYGYSGVRGLNALLATVTTTGSAPLVVAQRLRKGSCGSPRGAKRLVADALKTVRKLPTRTVLKPLVRADSASYGAATVGAAVRGGADVSVTVRLDPKVKKAIAAIGDNAWTPIEYTDAVYDEQAGAWVSRAEVAEIGFTAFSSKKAREQVPGRLVVRRIPDLNPRRRHGQDALFDTWRFHAFFTTTDPADLDTVAADKTHRGHAIIEQVHADLKNSALAHLPSGKFTANAAWLVTLKVWAHRCPLPRRRTTGGVDPVMRTLARLDDTTRWAFARPFQDVELPQPVPDQAMLDLAADLELLVQDAVTTLVWVHAKPAFDDSREWLDVADRVTTTIETDVVTRLRRRIRLRRLRAAEPPAEDRTDGDDPNEEQAMLDQHIEQLRIMARHLEKAADASSPPIQTTARAPDHLSTAEGRGTPAIIP